MSNYDFTALLKKKITFQRLSAKNVLRYEIYATYKDESYDSGKRTELLDIIENPKYPNPIIKKIELGYDEDATWELPHDAYLDRDHQFRLYLNDFILTHLCYSYNKITKKFSLDTVMKKYSFGDKVELEYYQDLIIKEYMVEENCQISVKPIFTDSYAYGFHNVII